ncbi:MAG TPA: tRNA 2-thiouridine(34) synthase MnmA [Dehalococcoidia bacterium]|nr:tRNA 2-thiouridine(34) synthase MnmA [Dehalococcoidia bacterium]
MGRKRVLVAMSGGVDSSVAAALLLEQGYQVVGVTMRLWTLEDPLAPRLQRRCCSVEDTEDARAAADVLGIPHYVLNFERQFQAQVVDYFVGEYASGRTPNPCIACNQHIKFGPLLEYAAALGCDYVATGHYVRRRLGLQGYELWRAVDPQKDQSYVLYMLGQEELARTLFPVGEHTKDEVRAMARRLGLPNADKPDSADICFVPNGDYRSFVRQRAAVAPGPIVDRQGNVLGEHTGIVGYTVGQRRGLPARGGSRPLYVLEVDARANAIVVGGEEELYAEGAECTALRFVCGRPPAEAVEVEAKVRYRAPTVPALLTADGERGEVRFREPQRAVAPGQAIVFYQGERVLGGGIIARVLRPGR